MNSSPWYRTRSFWRGFLAILTMLGIAAVAMLGIFALSKYRRPLPAALQQLELRTNIKNSFDAEWRKTNEKVIPELSPLGLGSANGPLEFMLTGADAATFEKVKPALGRVLSRYQVKSVSLKVIIDQDNGVAVWKDETVAAQP